MRYIRHNYIENFLNATGSEDEIISRDILLDELAQRIVKNHIEIIDVLRESGIKIGYDASDTKIVDVLYKNLDKNKLLAENIVKFITDKNSKYYNAVSPETINAGVSILQTVFGAVKDVKDAKLKEKEIKAARKEREEARKILLAKIAAMKGKEKKKGLGQFGIIGITVVSLVALYFVIQAVSKNK